ncbi:MAG TPA: type II TA system antitoxin MqsA family protein [Gemmataceae bacterium]|nr:type II TA system antitoxin MqsA family protein [Gemmataceae bacterium]
MNANRTSADHLLEHPETPGCPECGHSEIDTRWEDHPFPYGRGADAVEISVRLPVRKCRKCGFEFFDEEAEDLSHEAVCHHLGRLTPQQIKDLREKYGFSRADLERLTGLGEASIARWERGELIQNAGNDSLLWLLNYQENVDRLRMRANAEEPLRNPNKDLFPGLKDREAAARKRAMCFELCASEAN